MTAANSATRGIRAGRLVPACVLALLAAGCSILGSGDRERATILAPDPRVPAVASWPQAQWQLALASPTAARAIDSFRIAVRPVPGELQVYAGASWAKTPTDMLQDTVLRALEDSGRIAAVARQGSGIGADYRLAMDLRRFEADYAGDARPAATIEVNAKLLHTLDQKIVASRTFLVAEPAAGTEVAVVADAFSRALAGVSGEIAGWLLEAGNAHERDAHGGMPAPPR